MILKTKKFRFWHNENNDYDLIIMGNVLYVNIELPYSFKWVQILDDEGRTRCSKIYISDSCKCHLSPRTSGKYYYYLYCSHNGICYDCFIGGKQIVLELDEQSQWHFILPLFTSWNRELIKTENLKYVLCNTVLDNHHTMVKAARRLTSNCYSIWEKVLHIHDFVASNLYYDLDSLKLDDNTNRTVEQIVSEKRCVCQGYADLTLVLLQSIGITAENILCFAISDIFERGWSSLINRTAELNHIITRVKLENRWLYMDVTWDSNNRYEGGKYIKGQDISHRYFDVTLPFLSTTHRLFKK